MKKKIILLSISIILGISSIIFTYCTGYLPMNNYINSLRKSNCTIVKHIIDHDDISSNSIVTKDNIDYINIHYTIYYGKIRLNAYNTNLTYDITVTDKSKKESEINYYLDNNYPINKIIKCYFNKNTIVIVQPSIFFYILLLFVYSLLTLSFIFILANVLRKYYRDNYNHYEYEII